MGSTYRMFTGGDGKATWEAVELDSMTEWTDGIDVTQIRYGARAPGVIQDWHPAPQRQFVIILSGQLEILSVKPGKNRVWGSAAHYYQRQESSAG